MMERMFPAKDSALPELTDWVETELALAGCPTKTAMGILIALEEVFVNVAHYAYGGGEGPVWLGLSLDRELGEACLRLADAGQPFDPLQRPDPDLSAPALAQRVGGLGIFMTRKLMDQVSYAYQEGRNVLTLRKAFQNS